MTNNQENNSKPVLDHGFVILKETMGNDQAIVDSARVSYGSGTKSVRDDASLIRYLMRHSHTTPFEMIEFKFIVKCPIFVARQWMRHRTSSYNEYSLRYSQALNEFYLPDTDNIHAQSTTNKQGRGSAINEKNKKGVQWVIENSNKHAWDSYQTLLGENNPEFYDLYGDDSIFDQEFLGQGIARESARMVLSVNNYTQFYWKVNLKNFMHFVKLRADNHAQWEIQEYARAMAELAQPLVPMAWQAFEDYWKNSKNLSSLDQCLLQSIIAKTNQNQIGFSQAWQLLLQENQNIENLAQKYKMSKREISEFAISWNLAIP